MCCAQVLDAIMGSVAHPELKPLATGDRVALMVNTLGATPPLELAVVANAALRLARSQHQVPATWADFFGGSGLGKTLNS